MHINRRTLSAPLCALLLFAGNAYLCHDLFHAEFTNHMESIEGSYMSISRWAMNHWNDLSWFPVWFDGMPFHQVYQPGFHFAVASIGTLFGWTTQHAYHFFTAMEYCLGPVTLFLLCYFATRRLGYSVATGVIYSLLSASSLVSPAIRHDTSNLVLARRFLVLVHYGEGPHTTALMMLPLALLAVHYAATERRRWAILIAPVALAALALTNWPGTTGFCLAMTAYLVSRLGATPTVHWPTLFGVAVLAYMIACPWIPPSIIYLARRNAAQSDAFTFGAPKVLGLLGLLAAVLFLHLLLRWGKINEPWLEFFLGFSLITGVIAIGHVWFGWHILPQPGRFHLEFEMPCAAILGWLGNWVYERSARAVRIGIVIILIVACFYAGKQFRRYARGQTTAIDVTTTIEYQMARWFDEHMEHRRVFAPGNVSLWMGMFTETPEMAGCCDQGIPVQQHRIADYTIYTDMNDGPNGPDMSLLWLKAYGVDAIGISGPNSTECFKPFLHPYRFEGVLPVLWRDGDNAVYSVGRRSQSLAHVVVRDDIVAQLPENRLAPQPLLKYVNAIEAENSPWASFRWLSLHQARIRADVPPGRIVSLQISYDPGWRVTVAGKTRQTSPDGLGLMIIDPRCTGDCTIDLDWDGGAEGRWMPILQLSGCLLLLAWIVLARRQQTNIRRKEETALPPGPLSQ
jgi:hypothetical protein